MFNVYIYEFFMSVLVRKLMVRIFWKIGNDWRVLEQTKNSEEYDIVIRGRYKCEVRIPCRSSKVPFDEGGIRDEKVMWLTQALKSKKRFDGKEEKQVGDVLTRNKFWWHVGRTSWWRWEIHDGIFVTSVVLHLWRIEE